MFSDKTFRRAHQQRARAQIQVQRGVYKPYQARSAVLPLRKKLHRGACGQRLELQVDRH